VLSAAQQLVVVLKNSVRRGYDTNGDKDNYYFGPVVFMGKKEKARHVLPMQDGVSLAVARVGRADNGRRRCSCWRR
jgi:hypothetical protein